MQLTEIITIGALLINVVVLVVAMRTANAAKLSAETARMEINLARRPLIVIKPWGANIGKFMSDKASLTISGTLREVVGVPTTVHSVRVHAKAAWEPDMPPLKELPFSHYREMLLYRGAVTRPVSLASVDMTLLDTKKLTSPDLIALIEVVCTFSIQGGPREECCMAATVWYEGEGPLRVQDSPSDYLVRPEQDNQTNKGWLAKWKTRKKKSESK